MPVHLIQLLRIDSVTVCVKRLRDFIELCQCTSLWMNPLDNQAPAAQHGALHRLHNIPVARRPYSRFQRMPQSRTMDTIACSATATSL
ncbi:hypothetical protein BCF46_1447 [Litoreibacter meonggei]|uniref:Uncharacterized protein n=2 Tax=Litoreibacter meonggei TaxID=1049199 RepID=A0A497X389_9RHOB|nr:hypothetical protein BCF46_1447 [Litoreibacter meonggei]